MRNEQSLAILIVTRLVQVITVVKSNDAIST